MRVRRLVSLVVCVVVAGLVSVGVPAGAVASPVAPTVTVAPVTVWTATTATFEGWVDPEGVEAEYQFEYSTDGVHWSVVDAGSPGRTEAVSTVVVAFQTVSGLSPETTYFMRLHAHSSAGEATSGETVSFITSVTGGNGLPDGRGYEMVSPVVNEDSTVYEPTGPFAGTKNQGVNNDNTKLPFQAAADGNAVVYAATPSSGGNGSSGSLNGNENLARRSATGGWTVANIQPASFASPVYQAFSSDLSVGILDSEEVLSAGAPGGEYDVLYAAATNGSGYAPLFTVTPPHRTAHEFEASNFEPPGPARNKLNLDAVAYAGASADMGHLLFEANDTLTPPTESVDGGQAENNLYDSVGGVLRSVNILPDGAPEANATFGAPPDKNGTPADFNHVISADGSRIFWTDLNTNTLYVRESDSTTIQVDAAEPGAPGPSGGGRFWTASSDGSRVFFTDQNRLTSDSTAVPSEPDLYEYNVGTGQLTDLTVETAGVEANAGEHANVQGVLGASEDGSYVYFVAEGVLASGATPQASCGLCNLYVLHDGEPVRFIATLQGESADWESAPGYRSAQVTPDGKTLVFESVEPLTGYDNAGYDEIFAYDAASGRIACASCNPSGAPASVPPFRVPAALQLSWSATYADRFVSDDGGRVFFDSLEALAPQDINGEPDAYEWEREGSGSCRRSGGCVFLLSGGTSSSQSYVFDASASGNDVFMVTRAQLAPQDRNEVFDVYDARVGAPVAVAPPACSGTGCQGPPETPPIFATPSSVTFNGVGNFATPAKPKVNAKTKKPKRKAKTNKRKAKRKAKKSDEARRSGARAISVHGKAGRS